MTGYELNARIAMKLFPGKTIHRNGEEIKCANRRIDFRHPHLSERLIHEISETRDITIHRLEHKAFDVNGYHAPTLSEAVALAYLDHALE